jgi:hypothetical protein
MNIDNGLLTRNILNISCSRFFSFLPYSGCYSSSFSPLESRKKRSFRFCSLVSMLLIVLSVCATQVRITLRVLTRPVADMLPTIYRTLGENYADRVLPSIVQETLKAVVAQYNASQLITQREVLNYELFAFNCSSKYVLQ